MTQKEFDELILKLLFKNGEYTGHGFYDTDGVRDCYIKCDMIERKELFKLSDPLEIAGKWEIIRRSDCKEA